MTWTLRLSLRSALITLVCLLTALIVVCRSRTPRLRPLAGDDVILAFGDSLTAGTGADADQAYPPVLSRLVGRTVVNAGQPGELSADGLARLPAALAQHRPHLVILCHGGNDFLQNRPEALVAEHIEEMVRTARDAGADVVLIGVPRPGILLRDAPLYAQVAAELNVPCAGRVLGPILSQRSLKSDRAHPNASGYACMAEAVAEVLRQAGAIPPR